MSADQIATESIVVAGGGIGGPVAALSLHDAGHDVEVLTDRDDT